MLHKFRFLSFISSLTSCWCTAWVALSIKLLLMLRTASKWSCQHWVSCRPMHNWPSTSLIVLCLVEGWLFPVGFLLVLATLFFLMNLEALLILSGLPSVGTTCSWPVSPFTWHTITLLCATNLCLSLHPCMLWCHIDSHLENNLLCLEVASLSIMIFSRNQSSCFHLSHLRTLSAAVSNLLFSPAPFSHFPFTVSLTHVIYYVFVTQKCNWKSSPDLSFCDGFSCNIAVNNLWLVQRSAQQITVKSQQSLLWFYLIIT